MKFKLISTFEGWYGGEVKQRAIDGKIFGIGGSEPQTLSTEFAAKNVDMALRHARAKHDTLHGLVKDAKSFRVIVELVHLKTVLRKTSYKTLRRRQQHKAVAKMASGKD